MGELRRNLLTGQWTAVAPERGHRPDEGRDASASLCPFCPGQEDVAASALRYPADGPWSVLVVPNRFPVVTPDGPPHRHRYAVGTAAEARGVHEVIVESPRHDWDLTDASADQLSFLLDIYADRSRAAAQTDAVAVLLFRNHGVAAGTSLTHPHAQLVSLPVPTPLLQASWRRARQHAEKHGRELQADLIAAEIADGRRIIHADDHLTALVPFAANAAFETWLVPTSAESSFADSAAATRRALGPVLLDVLRALKLPPMTPPTTSSCTTRRTSILRWTGSAGTSRSCRARRAAAASNSAPGSPSTPCHRRKLPRGCVS
jgi:UDPglucose--hexose-1-phosphate uridylyltransferase